MQQGTMMHIIWEEMCSFESLCVTHKAKEGVTTNIEVVWDNKAIGTNHTRTEVA
jgi:hypothetical protein